MSYSPLSASSRPTLSQVTFVAGVRPDKGELSAPRVQQTKDASTLHTTSCACSHHAGNAAARAAQTFEDHGYRPLDAGVYTSARTKHAYHCATGKAALLKMLLRRHNQPQGYVCSLGSKKHSHMAGWYTAQRATRVTFCVRKAKNRCHRRVSTTATQTGACVLQVYNLPGTIVLPAHPSTHTIW